MVGIRGGRGIGVVGSRARVKGVVGGQGVGSRGGGHQGQ